MTDWATLCDAYGSAERVPVLLEEAATAGSTWSAVWDELWGRLCHQGTVASASYAALPALAELSSQHEPAGYVPALQLAAGIVASTDGPEQPAVVRKRYTSELATLREVAARNLGSAEDDTEFVYALQALMAFEDGGVWQRNLEAVADGEAQFKCPSCSEALLLSLEGHPFRVRSFTDGSVEPTTVELAERAPDQHETRLLTLARDHGRPAVAETLVALFGTATCPSCHTTFEIPHALT